MKLVTVKQMREIESEANTSGFSYDQMMAHAGMGIAQEVKNLELNLERQVILGLVGPGNNGGDTLVALTHLGREGWSSHAYLINRKKDNLLTQFLEMGGVAIDASADTNHKKLAELLKETGVLLDGILGTGIKPPLKTEIAQVLDAVKSILSKFSLPPVVIAVDCPTGVDCDTGEAAQETLRADLTVTMGAAKQGMVRLPAFEYIGELVAVDLGFPHKLKTLENMNAEVADRVMIKKMLPSRPLDAHKGTFGTIMIAAGSTNYTGAALLAGKAAYRSGAGLVTLAIPASIHTTIAGQFPEATWILLPHQQGVIAREAAEVLSKNLDRATTLLVGPGFGTETTTREFIENLLSANTTNRRPGTRIGFVHEAEQEKKARDRSLPPMVFDADGLKLLANIKEWYKVLPALSILTPHPGEMSVLTGLAKDEIQVSRSKIAMQYSGEWGHVVVLKGALTIVAAPDGRSTVIPVATAALARAGSGDVLAGVIAGLLGQGLEPYQAAVAGAWIHARAGMIAQEELGSSATVIASDILDSIPDVYYELGA
jgi:NAD(P)H-hydrate epimerase